MGDGDWEGESVGERGEEIGYSWREGRYRCIVDWTGGRDWREEDKGNDSRVNWWIATRRWEMITKAGNDDEDKKTK